MWKFIKKHYGKILVVLAALAALGLMIACMVSPPVLPFIVGTGILGAVATSALGLQVFVSGCLAFAATIVAGLGLKGILDNGKRLVDTVRNWFRSEPLKNLEEGFFAKHWGKLLLTTAILLAFVTAMVAAPYIVPFLGPVIAAATVGQQWWVVFFAALPVATLALSALSGILSPVWEGLKALCCCSLSRDEYRASTIDSTADFQSDGLESTSRESAKEGAPPSWLKTAVVDKSSLFDAPDEGMKKPDLMPSLSETRLHNTGRMFEGPAIMVSVNSDSTSEAESVGFSESPGRSS